ncbi:hypothetical protein TCSYLVIO_007668 [Trypanosoma cruzi]|nr:hypothetical protein TCSYLVIO_007668 [Trypanosoma cruzi]
MSSCSVGTITRDATARCRHNTRAVKHPTRTAQLRPAGTAGSKGHSRLFRPAVPMALGVALARLGGRCAMQPHCNACRQNSQGPPPPQQQNVQSATTPQHYRPFLFCFIHVVRLFAPSPTQKISAHLQKREGTKRKGGTIPPSRRGPTLSSTHHHCRAGKRSHIAEEAPQCAPHNRALKVGRDAAMHRPASFYHPQVLRAHKKQQTESECTQTQSPPSLAEAHYSHGVTFEHNSNSRPHAISLPTPQKDTTTLRNKSDSPSVLPAVNMEGQITRTHGSGSLAV